MTSATQTIYYLTLTHQPVCQTPHYNKNLYQISPRCLTHYTTGHRGQFKTHPSSPQSTCNMTNVASLIAVLLTNKCILNLRILIYRLQQNRRTFTNYKNADWTQFSEDTESAFTQTTNIHPANIIFTNVILMAGR